MEQVVRRVLLFDHLALDLTRGCLRAGEQDIPLRPKTFDLLQHLAENAGRLVPKQELYEALWPNVVVSDDSLVQCIRELREKLGDDGHQLIKTVPRRGYLLDAIVTVAAPEATSTELRPDPAAHRLTSLVTGAPDHVVQAVPNSRRREWAAAAAVGLLAVAALTLYFGDRWPLSFANPEARRIALTAPAPLSHRASFKDCEVCPEMVALPPGEFLMGSPDDEPRRTNAEGPQRRIVITKPFALGKFEVTNAQFSAFAENTGLTFSHTCHIGIEFDGDDIKWSGPVASYREPGFDSSESHPAVCISLHDAEAYVAWLRRRTGKPYRLATEAEWEYAARAGTTTSYSFGNDDSQLCGHARFADLDSRFAWRSACRSDLAVYGPHQVGRLKPNPWGLFDMHGNVFEWIEDCWSPDTSQLPSDGSAFLRAGHCEIGVVRGGGFASGRKSLRSASRRPVVAAKQYQTIGFRVALSLGET
jgi:formylglycine-generating enzyme required for sulfatase activity